MSRPRSVTHLLRAAIVGGSELETCAITHLITDVHHRLLLPARFADWQPSILDRLPRDVAVDVVDDVEAELQRRPPDLVHIQFPFILAAEPAGHDTVLELRGLPIAPTVFTVHAAVNIPVVEHVHYVFHTPTLAACFADRIPAGRRSVCPSLVDLPLAAQLATRRRADDRVRILWVSRNEDAKFHPRIGDVCTAMLRRHPEVAFHFVGRPTSFALPAHPRVTVEVCPARDLAAAFAAADLFWAFPHPLLEETWCRSVTEAMAWELPCVVAAHGAMAEQLDGERAGLVADSLEACIAALSRLVRDSELRVRMGRAGRHLAARYRDAAIDHWHALYRRLLARPHSR